MVVSSLSEILKVLIQELGGGKRGMMNRAPFSRKISPLAKSFLLAQIHSSLMEISGIFPTEACGKKGSGLRRPF